MSRKLKTILPTLIASVCVSCGSIHDSLEDCGFYLEFVYDYNMEYVCSFTTHVPSVDVYVFGGDDKLVATRRALVSELTDGNKMYLNEGFDPGTTYKILAVGGLCDQFALTDAHGNPCRDGQTSITDLQLALERQSDEVSHEFTSLWFSREVASVAYPAYKQTVRVPLVKDTNVFNITLVSNDANGRSRGPSEWPSSDEVPYTFEIHTPEGGVYGWDNAPIRHEAVRYIPHTLSGNTSAGSLAVARMNTMRLLDDRNTAGESGYRFVVRNRKTLQAAWDYDLIDLLDKTNGYTRPDGSPLPMHEYLDRKSVWDIIILHRGGFDEQDDGFTALAIRVGPWIHWFHDVDINW